MRADTLRQRALAVLLSLVVHLVLGFVLVYGLSLPARRVQPQMPTVIQATVVTPDQLAAVREQETQRLREEAAERRRAEEAARQEQARREAAEAEAQRREREQAEQERAERERQAQAEAEAQRQRRERAEAERRLLEEQQKQMEELRRQREAEQRESERRQQELARIAAEKRAQEQARAEQLERERLQQLMDMERQQMASAEQASLEAQWVAAIKNLVTQNWRRPPTSTVGTSCMVRVDQLPGGDVVNATVLPGCQADEITRRSIIDAVMRSEPLPYKGFEDVFRRQITFEFVVAE